MWKQVCQAIFADQSWNDLSRDERFKLMDEKFAEKKATKKALQQKNLDILTEDFASRQHTIGTNRIISIPTQEEIKKYK